MNSSSTDNRTTRATLIVVAVALGIGLIVLALVRYTQRKGLAREYQRIEVAMKDGWAKYDTIPIGGYDAVCSALRDSAAFREISGHAEHAEALIGALGSFLVAYTHGDVDHYARFRFPMTPTLANSMWDVSAMEFYGELASELAIDFGDLPYAASNRMVLTRLFQDHRTLTRAAPELFGTRMLRSFSPEGSRVEIQESPLPAVSVSDWVMAETGLGMTTPAPVMGYRFEDEAAAERSTVVARVRLLCGTHLETSAFPIYLQFLWYPESACFVPTELVFPLSSSEVPDLLF